MDLYEIKDLLDRSINDQLLYAFYEYGDDGFYCGYVLSYNTDTVQLAHYTKYGERDGSLIIALENIKSISIKDEYLDTLDYLIKRQKQFHQLNESESNRLIPTSEGLKNQLELYQNDRSVILNLKISDEGYIGFVDEVRNSCFIFTEIDNLGHPIVTNLYRISDVSTMRVNDKAGRKALFLYNKNKKDGL